MTTLEISGKQIEVPAGAIAYKYADPTEGARWVYLESDLDDIRREDPSLLVMVPETLADLDPYDAKHTVSRTIKSLRPSGAHKSMVATYTCECGCFAGTSSVAYANEGELVARDIQPSCPVVQVHRWLEKNARGTQEMAVIALGIEPETVAKAFAQR